MATTSSQLIPGGLQVDSPAGSVTEALMRVASNPMQAELLSEHRRIQKGRKDLQFQVLTVYLLCTCHVCMGI